MYFSFAISIVISVKLRLDLCVLSIEIVKTYLQKSRNQKNVTF